MSTSVESPSMFTGIMQIFLLIILILINAFFAMSEIAIITLNENKIKKLASSGHKQAQKVLRLTENTSNFLATIQVGVTLSGFLTSAAASQSFSEHLANALTFLNLPLSTRNLISTVLITIILSYFSLVLGELAPKKIAMQKAEEISFKSVGILLTIRKIFSPFIKFLSASSNLVVRMFGIDPFASEDAVTEEEILMMLGAGEEKGIFEETTTDMIENIFDFDDLTASEIMTHRIDMISIEDNKSISETVDLSIKYGRSRIPVFHGDIDNIIGIIHVKDLLKYISKEDPSDTKITDVMREVLYIPETKNCSDLFKEMIDSKTHIAIIVDEYGGTSGLITIEDLVESIVGSIQDEYDNEKSDIMKTGENSFTVEGSSPIDEISNLLNFELPKGDYDTIAGLIFESIGKVPKENEHPSVQIGEYLFTVESIEDRRIEKVKIVKQPPEIKS